MMHARFSLFQSLFIEIAQLVDKNKIKWFTRDEQALTKLPRNIEQNSELVVKLRLYIHKSGSNSLDQRPYEIELRYMNDILQIKNMTLI